MKDESEKERQDRIKLKGKNHSQTISAFRSVFLRSPQRSGCLKKGRVARGQYQCAECGHIGKQKEFCVDHIDPIIALDENRENGYNYNKVFEKLWDERNLQLLCKAPCHKEKTARENKMRKKPWDGVMKRRQSKKLKSLKRKLTNEHKENLRKRLTYNNPMKDPETVKQVVETKRQNGHFDNPIICVETKIVYKNMTDAQEKTGIAGSNIGRVINGKRKTAGGYTWETTNKKCR